MSEEYNSENINRRIQIANYKSKNINRNKSIHKMQVGTIQFGKDKSEIYNSENTNRKIQVGRIVGRVPFGTIYDIATLQQS